MNQYFLNWYKKYGIIDTKSKLGTEKIDWLLYHGMQPTELAFCIPTSEESIEESIEDILEIIEKRFLLTCLGKFSDEPIKHIVFDGMFRDIRSIKKLRELFYWSDYSENFVPRSWEKIFTKVISSVNGKIICINRIPWESRDGKNKDAGWTSFYRRIGFGVVQ